MLSNGTMREQLLAATIKSDGVRECGTCSLCCKLPRIKEIDKPANTWCPLCKPGSGCTVYEMRPNICRQFSCLWLSALVIPDDYRPDKIGAFVTGSNHEGTMQIYVDDGKPLAWREGKLKALVDLLLRAGLNVILLHRKQRTFMNGVGASIPPGLQRTLTEQDDGEKGKWNPPD